MTPVRIGLLNYADVLNFGDVLFPLLAGQIFAAGGVRFLAAAAEAEANVDALFDALAAAIASHGPRRHG